MTKALLSGLLGGLLALGTPAGPARAEVARSPKAYVVLIGISNYQDKQIKPRPHAEDDVKGLYDLFSSKAYLGVDAKRIRLLTGTEDATRHGQKATRENILKTLQSVATQAGVDDLVLLVFIGEGGLLGEHGDRRCYFAA